MRKGGLTRLRYANSEMLLALALIALVLVSGVAIMTGALLWLLRH